MSPYPQPHPVSSAPESSELSRLDASTTAKDLKRQLELHYHKGLHHNDFGQIGEDQLPAFAKLQVALAKHRPELFKAIELPDKGRPLVNPQAGLAADRECAEGFYFRLPKAPEHCGQDETTAGEFIELYWMALLRTVPFDQWETHPGVQEAISELSELKLYTNTATPNAPTYTKRSLTTNSLFRGGDWDPEHREHSGGFISQFLLLQVPYGSQSFDQRERLRAELDQDEHSKPHMTTWDNWLAVQRGASVGTDAKEISDSKATYLHDMSGLARYVHLDKLYQAYLNAAFILIGAPSKEKFGSDLPYGCRCSDTGGNGTLDERNDGKDFPREEGFGTFGVPHVLSLVTEVATRALKSVWYQKWVMNLRMRPEAYGGLVERALGTEERDRQSAVDALGKALEIIRSSRAASEIQKANAATNRTAEGTFLLPMSFKEGSPIHPAYGAGHATVAAACVTVLKAFFDGSKTFEDLKLTPQEPNPEKDYRELRALPRGSDKTITVGTELDKLISNISIGRNMAGVHWRTDYSQSALLGQRIAISMLYRQRRDYHERPWKMQFRTLGGNHVSIEYNNAGREGVYFTPDGGPEVLILDASADEGAGSGKAEAEALEQIV